MVFPYWGSLPNYGESSHTSYSFGNILPQYYPGATASAKAPRPSGEQNQDQTQTTRHKTTTTISGNTPNEGKLPSHLSRRRGSLKNLYNMLECIPTHSGTLIGTFIRTYFATFIRTLIRNICSKWVQLFISGAPNTNLSRNGIRSGLRS